MYVIVIMLQSSEVQGQEKSCLAV